MAEHGWPPVSLITCSVFSTVTSFVHYMALRIYDPMTDLHSYCATNLQHDFGSFLSVSGSKQKPGIRSSKVAVILIANPSQHHPVEIGLGLGLFFNTELGRHYQ